MKELFEKRDMSEAVFRDVNLAGATFEDVNLAGATIRNANLGGLSIDDAYISGLTVLGFRVDELIAAELDRRDPERVRLRMADCYDPQCVRAVFERLDQVRTDFRAFLGSLDGTLLVMRPEPDEWSALENLRHMVFAQDMYLNRWLLQNKRPWCRLGLLPAFLADRTDFSDVGSEPCDDLATVLAVWDELQAMSWQYVDGLTPEELRRDTSKIDFGQGDVGQVLQGLAQHDLAHIRQAERAVAQIRGSGS
jgi:uncharacterized protein YjbI with pentapeptide repeats